MVSSTHEATTTSTPQPPIHYSWYAIGFSSALIMGLSAFVITCNFMLGQAPLILVLGCATAGFILNTSLYWIDSAEKLATFFKTTINNPRSLLHVDALLCLSSAICIGFLALESYINQLASLPKLWLPMLPTWPIALGLSIANVISTFVLFYTPENTSIEASKQSQSTIGYQQWLTSLFRQPWHHYLGYILGSTQSLMYSLTNLFSVFNMINLLAPQMHLMNWTISITLASALLIAECQFNCSKAIELFERKQANRQSNWPSASLQNGLYSLIIMNGLANGWIALGTLVHLPLLLKASIITIGFSISFAIMESNLQDINEIIVNPHMHLHRLLPSSTEDMQKMCKSMANALILIVGTYICCSADARVYLLQLNKPLACICYATFVFTFVNTSHAAMAWLKTLANRNTRTGHHKPNPINANHIATNTAHKDSKRPANDTPEAGILTQLGITSFYHQVSSWVYPQAATEQASQS